MKKKLLFYFIIIYINLMMQFSHSEISGKNSYELIEDSDFKEAVNILIHSFYHEGSLTFSEAVQNIIEEYCFVENNKIKCKK